MRSKIILLTISITALLTSVSCFAEETSEESLMPGRINEAGNHFEIKNSEYLNIFLESSEEIKIVLESAPKMISLMFERVNDGAESAIFSIKGLEPNKIYYKYEDSYKNGAVFDSDENGNYSWIQDLAQPHHVWIQEEKSTMFLPENCSNYGIWDAATLTCVLNQDLTESVEVSQDNITLDCSGHSITGSRTGYGVYIKSKQGIVIKNCKISNFWSPILLNRSSNNTLSGNTTFNNSYLGIYLSYSSNNNALNNNTSSSNGAYGIYLYNSSFNILYQNSALNSGYGITLDNSSNNNTLSNNIVSNSYYGILLNKYCNSNTIIGNSVASSFNKGIFINYYSDDNTVVNNTISLSLDYGIYLAYSNGAKIYHNNFIENRYQADFYPLYFNNLFDNGYPSGGNYWSDYTGIDEKSGTNQDQLGSDGIGDTPYIFGFKQDKYPFVKENGWELPQEPPKWSFAIITDLHIGRGYSDYDGTGYGADGEGEDYYLTERLKKVVNWINTNKNNVDCEGTHCSIKFLAVLGDISDTAEKSEFLKAKNVLDKLNDPNGDGNTADGIPYAPVFGNHDVWPYVDNKKATSSLGEDYFDEIFWDENATNTKLLKERFNFQKDEENKKYKNFAFSYKGMNFIGLDFDERNPASFGYGVGSDAVLSDVTKNWLDRNLDENSTTAAILFSHHPLVGNLTYGFSSGELSKIQTIIENKNVLVNFGGHIHGFEEFLGLKDIFMDANKDNYTPVGTTSVITTEALMACGNEKDLSNKGIIRIVKVSEGGEINASTTEGKFPALNPYISFDYKILPEQIYPCVFFKAHNFTHRDYSLAWDLGDGNIGSGEFETYCYNQAGIYNVKLTAIDKETGEQEYITRKVEVKQGIIPKIIQISEEAKEKLELISIELGEKVTEFGRTMKDAVLIKASELAGVIGVITVHFEQAAEDIDLTLLVADIELKNKKSVLYMPEWPSIIEEEKILFIPK